MSIFSTQILFLRQCIHSSCSFKRNDFLSRIALSKTKNKKQKKYTKGRWILPSNTTCNLPHTLLRNATHSAASHLKLRHYYSNSKTMQKYLLKVSPLLARLLFWWGKKEERKTKLRKPLLCTSPSETHSRCSQFRSSFSSKLFPISHRVSPSVWVPSNIGTYTQIHSICYSFPYITSRWLKG